MMLVFLKFALLITLCQLPSNAEITFIEVKYPLLVSSGVRRCHLSQVIEN